MAEPTELNSIIQEVIDTRADMKSFNEFMNAAKDVIVARRLALPANSLDYYLNYLDAIKLVFTQANGDVAVGDKTVKSLSQLMLDAAQTLERTGGNIPYPTYAAMVADKANITNKMILEVTNDTDQTKNGKYTYDGVSVFTKSAYDPLTQSRFYTDTKTLNAVDYFDKTTEFLSSTPSTGRTAFSANNAKFYRYVSYDVARQPETTAFLGRMTVTPDQLFQSILNRLVYDLKQSGVWSKLDGLWLGRNVSFEDSKLNLIGGNNLVSTGETPSYWSPTNPYWSLNKYSFDTGVSPSSVVGVKFSRENMSIGGVFFSDYTQPTLINLGGSNDTVSLSYLKSEVIVRINQDVDTLVSIPVAPTDNTFRSVVATRDGESVSVYTNGALIKSNEVPSVSPDLKSIKFGRVDATIRTHAYATFIGKTLTDRDVLLLDKALNLYMTRYANASLPAKYWDEQPPVGITTTQVNRSIDTAVKPLNDFIFGAEPDVITTKALVGTVDESIINQEYMGGYIEIQPDSYIGGSPTATDSTTQTWGFPQSLSNSEQMRLRNDLLRGDGKGLQYIRFPLGYAYRGYRNIDPTSGLARNIGERYKGQNAALKKFFENISKSGGGLAPEYWCPPVHWLTSGSYHGRNHITAGGSYSRGTLLSSIRTTDPVQYAAQIDAFTDAVVDDYEYLHQNIAPVRMYGLSNEPAYSTQEYGACSFDAITYSDILLALHPKVTSSPVLSEFNGEPNKVLLHVCSHDAAPYWLHAEKLEAEHPEYIWAYTHHMIRPINGEVQGGGGDYYRGETFKAALGGRKNVFLNEFEYFKPHLSENKWKCSNNMLAYINSVIYSDSRLIMPIIHVCKQLGATSSSTNTEGYALTQCNLQEGYGLAPSDPQNINNAWYGTWEPVRHNYNAWKFIADNLPIGAVRIGGEPIGYLRDCNYVTYTFNSKLIVFVVNSTKDSVAVTLTFARRRKYNGKVYSIDNCGESLKRKTGKDIVLTLAPYSGQVWTEI